MALGANLRAVEKSSERVGIIIVLDLQTLRNGFRRYKRHEGNKDYEVVYGIDSSGSDVRMWVYSTL